MLTGGQRNDGVIRTELGRRGTGAVIPEKNEQTATRKRRGPKGGVPPAFDADAHKGRDVVERSFTLTKHWRGLATRYDKIAITYRTAVTLNAWPDLAMYMRETHLAERARWLRVVR
ncbi:MAG: transposase [Actinobacteria bacterium]|nr:transposase [Actinomycetota bacterium]MCG2803757.1 transposase [Cellulomonas sp.]